MSNIRKIIFSILIIMFIVISCGNVSSARVELVGDANLDGKIDLADSLKVLRYIAQEKTGKRPEWDLTPDQFEQSDIDDNDKVDITDVLQINRYIAAYKNETIRQKHPEWITNLQREIEVSPERVSLDKTELVLDVNNNNQAQLVATIYPEDSDTDTNLTWKSGNENIAEVSSSGLVKAIGVGKTTITVMTENEKQATCEVTVEDTSTNISLDKETVTLDLSQTRTTTLTATLTPNSTDEVITWGTSDATIATVSNTGVVTGRSNGICKITASLSNGKQASCTVTVQTSPTDIYFSENRVDSTGYLSVQKGSTSILQPVILPSTANVNNKVTYRISSGNSKVADVNSSTGQVTGKQAGVVTIEAKTANGKETTIRLNVKIGNTCFDTSVLENETYTSSNIFFSKNVDVGAGFSPAIASPMQSFDVDSSDKLYYATNGSGTRKDAFITYADRNKTSSDYMKITYFGHQSAIDMEESGNDRYIWVESVSDVKGAHGYTGNYCVSRMLYKSGDNYNFTLGTVKVKNTDGGLLETYENGTGQNFVYTTEKGNLVRYMKASIDEDNRLLGIYYNKSIFIYDLDEALAIPDQTYEKQVETDDGDRLVEFQAKNLSSIEKLATVTIQGGTNPDTDILSYAMQGFDLDGDYIYVAEGYGYTENETTKYISRAYVTAFDYMYDNNGNKPAKNRSEVIAINDTKSASQTLLAMMGDTNKAEIEGIKVNTKGTNPVMYLGMISDFKETGVKSTNIFKYTY